MNKIVNRSMNKSSNSINSMNLLFNENDDEFYNETNDINVVTVINSITVITSLTVFNCTTSINVVTIIFTFLSPKNRTLTTTAKGLEKKYLFLVAHLIHCRQNFFTHVFL